MQIILFLEKYQSIKRLDILSLGFFKLDWMLFKFLILELIKIPIWTQSNTFLQDQHMHYFYTQLLQYLM